MPTFTCVFDVKVDDLLGDSPVAVKGFSTYCNDERLEWFLGFYVKGQNFPLIGLHFDDSNVRDKTSLLKYFKVVVSFKLITTTDSVEQIFDFRNDDKCYHFTSGNYFDNGDVVPELLKIYPGNVFKLVCKLSIEKRVFTEIDLKIVGSPLFFRENMAISKLFSKITEDSEDEFFPSDVTLSSSDNIEFKCHRFVLCANSTVFTTMFSNKNFREATFPYRVDILDIDGEMLKEILRFIYTKTVSLEFGDLVEDILYYSEKYDLQELKSKCEHTLKFKVNAKNIFRYFEIADKYNLKSLLTSCHNFFEIYLHLFNEKDLEEFYAKLPGIRSILQAVKDNIISDVF